MPSQSARRRPSDRRLLVLARLAIFHFVRKSWQLQEAKNHLSEVVDLALEEGPQTVTRHGREVVVIVAKRDYERRKRAHARRGSVLTFLRGLGFARTPLKLDRSKDSDRDVGL
jgi:antitoxin Phd